MANRQQDVWSVGILMHYLLVGCTPFENVPGDYDLNSLMDMISKTRGMPNFAGFQWRGVTSEAKHLCASLLHADSRVRVTPTQALSHPWLTL